MTSLMLAIIGLAAVFVFGVVAERQYANFPLADCSTKEIDLVCLYLYPQYEKEEYMCNEFVNHLLSFPNNISSPRVRFAGVYDWFSAEYPDVNVSSWHFQASSDASPYGSDQETQIQEGSTVNETVKMKVEFLHRLFSDMGGVRENVTHIAIMFIDGRRLSFDEVRTVPRVLKQQDTDLKIFVLVLGVEFEKQVVHLIDTLLANDRIRTVKKHVFALALCQQCVAGWWKFQHSAGAESISCYKMFQPNHVHSNHARCYKEDFDVTKIESEPELTFLQSRIRSFLSGHEGSIYSFPLSANISIGLEVKYHIRTMFHWHITHRATKRPLVVNHWLSGEPSGLTNENCVAWQFKLSEPTELNPNVSEYKGRFVDGWASYDCQLKGHYSALCEASLSRRIEGNARAVIKPATSESFSRALNNVGLLKFTDNIVSVSMNIESDDFVQFLQQINYQIFPLFDCGEYEPYSRYISYSLVCNEVIDCGTMRDEFGCFDSYKNLWRFQQLTCPGILCCDGLCLLMRFINDGHVDCPICECRNGTPLNDESESFLQPDNTTCAFYCNSIQCIHFSQLNDGYVDCTGIEGPLDETIGKLEPANTCHNLYGHIIWAPKCVYVTDLENFVLGCRDMSHLKNCSDFECPVGYFKCPDAYCIPQHYVLDLAQECPTGEDEEIDNIGPCTGHFLCWDSLVCLHPDLVCDGHFDCPHYDDEVDCNLMCVVGFRCVSGTVTVSSYNKSFPVRTFPSFDDKTRYLDMSGLDLSVAKFANVRIPNNLTVIKLSNCNLSNMTSELFFNLMYVQEVDISCNHIQAIYGRYDFFVASLIMRRLNISYNLELVSVKHLQFVLLEILDLSYTSLSHLDSSFLKDLPILKYLNISFTCINSFPNRLFRPESNLQSLDLRGLDLGKVRENFFNGLTVTERLYTDSFEICCPQIRGDHIADHTCYAPDNAISSCYHLIGDTVQRVLLWLIALVAIFGNVIVVGYRLIWDRSILKTGHGLLALNLSISDFIMGVYASVIAGADYYYRDVYVLFQNAWTESHVCKFASFLSTLSSEMSTFLLFLMTLDMYLIKMFPYSHIKLSNVNVTCFLLITWTAAFILALTPIVFNFPLFYSNAMCLGLPLTTKKLKGSEFSFAVFIVLNSLVCLLTVCGQRLIHWDSLNGRENGIDTNPCFKSAEILLIVKQLTLMSAAKIACWLHVGIMGCMAFRGLQINSYVVSWTVIVVFPINSALNPCVNIINVAMDKWNQFKYGHRRSS